MDLSEIGILRDELRNHETLDAGRRKAVEERLARLAENQDALTQRRRAFEEALNRLRKMGHSE